MSTENRPSANPHKLLENLDMANKFIRYHVKFANEKGLSKAVANSQANSLVSVGVVRVAVVTNSVTMKKAFKILKELPNNNGSVVAGLSPDGILHEPKRFADGVEQPAEQSICSRHMRHDDLFRMEVETFNQMQEMPAAN